MTDLPNDSKETLTLPRYATFNQHILSSIIDMGILLILIMPFTEILVQLIYGPPADFDLASLAPAPGAAQDASQIISLLWEKMLANKTFERLALDNVLQIVFAALYVLPFWFYFAATPGKMLLRLEVRDDVTGGYMTRKQAVIRFLGYLVSALPLTLGFAWAAFNRKHQGFHDYIAKTVTIVKPSWKVTRINSAPRSVDQ